MKDVNDNTKAAAATDSPKAKGRKRNKTENAAPKAKKEKPDKNEAAKAKQAKVDLTSKKSAEVKSTVVRLSVEAKKEKAEAKSPVRKSEVVESKKEVNSWTRDEDKTMLQIMKGEVVTDQVFKKIKELLPHRSVSEIKERFFHVMNLLQQMAVGEVT